MANKPKSFVTSYQIIKIMSRQCCGPRKKSFERYFIPGEVLSIGRNILRTADSLFLLPCNVQLLE